MMALKKIVVDGKYTFDGKVRFVAPIGTVLKLTPNQAETRKDNLKKKYGPYYEVISPVEFKYGEEFFLDE